MSMVQPVIYPELAPIAQAQVTQPSQDGNSPVSESGDSTVQHINADGIASGVVTSMDQLNNYVWVNRQRDANGGNYGGMVGGRLFAPGAGDFQTFNGNSEGLNGLKVLAQWMDEDGTVSPIYEATTANLSGLSGGDGSYVFHFPNFTDENGNIHEFYARPYEVRVKLWLAPGQKNPETGLELGTLRSVPGANVGLNNEGDGGAGMWTNIPQSFVYTGVFTYEYPQADPAAPNGGIYLHAPSGDPRRHDSAVQGRVDGSFADENRGSVSGRVWWETGAKDVGLLNFPNSAGETFFRAGEARVVTSVLTPAGVAAMRGIDRDLTRAEQAAIQREILEQHPEYIMETVVAYTDDEGYYTAVFNNKDWDWRYLYQHLETRDSDGNWQVQSAYSSYIDAMYGKPDAQTNIPQL